MNLNEMFEAGKLDWGPWSHDTKNDALVCTIDGVEVYDFSLSTCATGDEAVIGWLFQIAPKTWATDAVMAGLVRALLETLYEPNGTRTAGREIR